MSHNFGFRFYRFLNTSIFLNSFLFCISLILYLNFKKFKKFLIIFSLKDFTTNFKSVNYIVYIIHYIIYISLLVLINDFLWNNFNINILNYQPNFNSIIFYLTVYLIIFVLNYNVKSLTLVISNLFYFLDNIVFYFTKTTLNNTTAYIHLFLLFLFFYSLLKYNYVYSNVDILNLNYFREVNYYFSLNLLNIEVKNNICEESTSFNGKLFRLSFISNLTLQFFYPIGLKTFFKISIVDFTPYFIYFTTSFISLFFIKFFKKVIMF